MKFRYKNIAPRVYRPIIPIEFASKTNASFGYEVLVDSGADICIFPGDIAELLEIDIYSGTRRLVQGITGKSEPYYIHSLTMKIGGLSFTTDVGFMKNPLSDWHGILGQQGFFDKFTVKFDYSKKEI